jgi:hypothetical protein
MKISQQYVGEQGSILSNNQIWGEAFNMHFPLPDYITL